MSYLMIKNVNKMFNKIKVLNGIDIEINKGEFKYGRIKKLFKK